MDKIKHDFPLLLDRGRKRGIERERERERERGRERERERERERGGMCRVISIFVFVQNKAFSSGFSH
jgi:hypothetical protein